MLSYTDMARVNTYRRPVSVRDIVSDPNLGEAWFNSLPAPVRAKLEARLKALVGSLPPVLRIELSRHMAAEAETPPVPLAVDGLGCACMSANPGLGQWAALVTGLAQIGTGLYQSKEMNDLQETLAKRSIASNESIEQARIAASAETTRLLAEAQVEAARLAQTGLVERTRLLATSPTVWGGAAALLAVGVGAFVILRRKKK